MSLNCVGEKEKKENRDKECMNESSHEPNYQFMIHRDAEVAHLKQNIDLSYIYVFLYIFMY